MSATPFHDVAVDLRTIADRVETLGDQVHTGQYTVPESVEPPAEGETPPETPPSFETTEELPAE